MELRQWVCRSCGLIFTRKVRGERRMVCYECRPERSIKRPTPKKRRGGQETPLPPAVRAAAAAYLSALEAWWNDDSDDNLDRRQTCADRLLALRRTK